MRKKGYNKYPDPLQGNMKIVAWHLQKITHTKNVIVFYQDQSFINPILPERPDPSAANTLQEGSGGQFGAMRTMRQYLFQSFNFRDNATPYRDLILDLIDNETLGVDWGKVLPIPKFDSSQLPEVKKLLDAGIHREQYHSG